MNLYLIYSDKTILITDDINDANTGCSIKYNSIDEMLNEFRNDLRSNEYDNINTIYEECADEDNNTFYIEITKTDALNLI